MRKVQIASLVMCYSRMLFVQIYPCFTRFECKVFLTGALEYFGGAAGRCMIDNTNVVRLKGTGKEMVPVPEMSAFGERFEFVFVAHEVGDANRSARVENPFKWVQRNFLVGREFSDRDDVNMQARSWCEDVDGHVNPGDLDADKIDYVARDAFYSGVPTASDVARILSSLRTIEVKKHNKGGLSVQFGGAHPEAYHLFSISTSAVSALEMFVATRAYLFERIYCHQKVRAAEVMLTRALETTVASMREESWSWAEILKFLLHPFGDDAVLSQLASGQVWDSAGASRLSLGSVTEREQIVDWARRLQRRALPRRALAFAKRLAPGGEERWTIFSGAMNVEETRRSLESQIRVTAGASTKDDVFLDWAPRHPIEENPEVWIEDPAKPGHLGEIGHFINVEQQANAYQGVKQIDWIFAPEEKKADVAAATAVLLQARFGLLLTAEALTRSKIATDEFTAALNRMQSRPDLKEYYDAMGRVADGPGMAKLTSLPNEWIPTLPRQWLQPIKDTTAKRLADELNAVQLPATCQADLEVVRQVFKNVLNYVDAKYNGIDLDERASSAQKKLEAMLAEDFSDHLRMHEDFKKFFKLIEQPKQGAGIVDFLCVSKVAAHRDTIIELKAKLKPVGTIAVESTGQPLQYMTSESSRIAILVAYFAESDNVQIEDTIQVWQSKSDTSPRAVICVGLKQRGDHPSALGKEAEPASKPAA
ncbi:MAG: hypothetical protein IPK13_21670 [Deltaproteobacteria bacterium]|nr:hypothetical protein [Deltaproteobacteria bacterium]